jgi:hypothetical protein
VCVCVRVCVSVCVCVELPEIAERRQLDERSSGILVSLELL